MIGQCFVVLNILIRRSIMGQCIRVVFVHFVAIAICGIYIIAHIVCIADAITAIAIGTVWHDVVAGIGIGACQCVVVADLSSKTMKLFAFYHSSLCALKYCCGVGPPCSNRRNIPNKKTLTNKLLHIASLVGEY